MGLIKRHDDNIRMIFPAGLKISNVASTFTLVTSLIDLEQDEYYALPDKSSVYYVPVNPSTRTNTTGHYDVSFSFNVDIRNYVIKIGDSVIIPYAKFFNYGFILPSGHVLHMSTDVNFSHITFYMGYVNNITSVESQRYEIKLIKVR